MQGDVLVGAIIFTMILLVKFIVITKGAGRVAEVSARFYLDAMPGKQMAIDADLSSGQIDEKRRGRGGGNWRRRSGFTAPWTAPASSCAATPFPRSS